MLGKSEVTTTVRGVRNVIQRWRRKRRLRWEGFAEKRFEAFQKVCLESATLVRGVSFSKQISILSRFRHIIQQFRGTYCRQDTCRGTARHHRTRWLTGFDLLVLVYTYWNCGSCVSMPYGWLLSLVRRVLMRKLFSSVNIAWTSSFVRLGKSCGFKNV